MLGRRQPARRPNTLLSRKGERTAGQVLGRTLVRIRFDFRARVVNRDSHASGGLTPSASPTIPARRDQAGCLRSGVQVLQDNSRPITGVPRSSSGDQRFLPPELLRFLRHLADPFGGIGLRARRILSAPRAGREAAGRRPRTAVWTRESLRSPASSRQPPARRFQRPAGAGGKS